MALNAVVPVASNAASTDVFSHRRHWVTRLRDWAWDYTHAEYSDFYSLEKLYAFQLCDESRLAYQLGSIGLATLPTIAVIWSLELIPLQDPALTWQQNPGFYVRQVVRASIGGIVNNIQIQEFIPQLHQPWRRLIPLALVQMSVYVAALVGIAAVFSIFPVPLSSVTPLLPVVVTAIVIRYLHMKSFLDRNPELKPIYARMERTSGFSLSIILLYSAYGFVFRRASSYVQVALSVVLYILKHWVKHRMWELSHVYDHHDLSAESISCGVHLFHALFTTTCLQSARSAGTFVVVLVLNLVQDALAFRFVRMISSRVDTLTKNGGSNSTASHGCSPWRAEWTGALLQHRATLLADSVPDQRHSQPPIMGLRSAYFRYEHASRAAMHVAAARDDDNVRLEKATHTQTIANLLHCREIVLLRLFADIVVPLFYFTYCCVMRYMLHGNWRYFENLVGLNQQTLLRLGLSILPLVIMKLVVMVELCRLFRAHGQPSGMRQLAFIVKAQRWSMQTWFIINFVLLIDFPLAHLGNDLSFRFRWLSHER